jgi:hypothetical protein
MADSLGSVFDGLLAVSGLSPRKPARSFQGIA